MVTLANVSVVTPLSCDLQLGYSWLHFSLPMTVAVLGCDLQLGYSWLHSLFKSPSPIAGCDLQLGYSWLHFPEYWGYRCDVVICS